MRYSLILAAALLAPVVAPAAYAQTVQPVEFARGTSSSTIHGAIRGNSYTDYRIVVRAGQRLSVTLTPVKGSPYFNVMEPGSQDVAIYNSSNSGQTYTGTTARNGAYTIRVYQMRAAGRRGETADFRLTLSVTGHGSATTHPSAPSHFPGDALVSGTPYHATSTIRCRSVAGAAMGFCNAGVIRRPSSATVHLDTPDGGERSILFREGRAVSSDSQSRMTSTRRGDVTTVRIGTVEIYEIPDALIEGG